MFCRACSRDARQLQIWTHFDKENKHYRGIGCSCVVDEAVVTKNKLLPLVGNGPNATNKEYFQKDLQGFCLLLCKRWAHI